MLLILSLGSWVTVALTIVSIRYQKKTRKYNTQTYEAMNQRLSIYEERLKRLEPWGDQL